MPRPGSRKRKALKLAAVKSQGCGDGVGTGSNPSGTVPTFPSTHSGDPTALCTSKVPVSPPLGDVPTSSKKRTFDDSVTLTNLPKGKEFKKFCGHIATGDYELASRTLFKVSESHPLKTLSKDSAGASPFLETRLGNSRITKTPGAQNLIDSKMVGKTVDLSTLVVDTFVNSKADSSEMLKSLDERDKEIDRLKKREISLLAKLEQATESNLKLIRENLSLREGYSKELQDAENKMRDVYVKNQIRCQLDVQRNQKLLGKNESLKLEKIRLEELNSEAVDRIAVLESEIIELKRATVAIPVTQLNPDPTEEIIDTEDLLSYDGDETVEISTTATIKIHHADTVDMAGDSVDCSLGGEGLKGCGMPDDCIIGSSHPSPLTLSLGGVDKEVLSTACQSQDNTGVSASIVREDEVQVKSEPIEIVEASLAEKLDNIIVNISDDDDDIVPH